MTIANRLITCLALPVLLLAAPLARAQTVVYYHTDALGSVVAVTDANRTVIEKNEYEPYGKVVNHALQDGPGYTGHVADAQTGLIYMQQRYYDDDLGEFPTVDPVSATSVGGNFNRYWYANSNPYRFNDPDGRVSDDPRRQPGSPNERPPPPPPPPPNGCGVTRSCVYDGNRWQTPTNGGQSGAQSNGRATDKTSKPSVLAGVTPGVNAFLLLGGVSANGGVIAGTDGQACRVFTLCGQLGLGIYGGAEVGIPFGYSHAGTQDIAGWSVGLAGGLGSGPAVTGDINMSISGKSGTTGVVGKAVGGGAYGAGQACYTWAACGQVVGGGE